MRGLSGPRSRVFAPAVGAVLAAAPASALEAGCSSSEGAPSISVQDAGIDRSVAVFYLGDVLPMLEKGSC